jgi:hypothetical protein
LLTYLKTCGVTTLNDRQSFANGLGRLVREGRPVSSRTTAKADLANIGGGAEHSELIVRSRLWASLIDAWMRRPRDLSMVVGTLLLCLLLVLWCVTLSLVTNPAIGSSLATVTTLCLLG